VTVGAARRTPVPVETSHRRWIIAFAILGVALRLAFGLGYWVHRPLTRDEVEYLSLARSLAAGRGFVYDEAVLSGPVQPFGRAPGYPLFLALTGGGGPATPSVPASVKLAQSVVGGIGIVLVAILAARVAGRKAGRAAALIAAVYPPLVWLPAYAYSEAVFWPVGLAIALVLDWLMETDRPGGVHAAVAGILTGAGILLRAALTVLLPIVALWLLVRRQLLKLALFALGTAVVLLPWAARNYAHHGRFVLVASDGGVTFWTGNNALATGEGDMAANPDIKIESLRLRREHPDLTEEQMEPVYYREAFSWIRAHPAAWAGLELKKAFYLVVPIGPSYRLHSAAYFVLSALSYAVLLPLAILGVVRAGAARWRTPGLWLMFASAIAVCLVFFPQERFRLPVIDPVLVIFAGTLVSRWPREQTS
jgi:4-amino-4-deoxy-L-arabinose transferase-like glycosyltransferase